MIAVDRARQSFRKTIKNPLRGRNIKFPGYFSPADTPVDSECRTEEMIASRVVEAELLRNQGVNQQRGGEVVEDKKGNLY